MVKDGSFVKLEYTGKTKEGLVFDTTSEADAKKSGVNTRNTAFGPVLIVAGKHHVLKGLDEALLNAQIGKQQTINLPAEKAFGKRNPELVRVVPESVFRAQGITPVAGLVVELDGRRARIQSASGGRVRVDFNHELAGQDVEYSFKVLEELTEANEILSALAVDVLKLPAETVSLKGGVCTVKVGPKTVKSAEFVVRKMRFIQLALQYIPEVKKIEFTEEYEKPKEKD
ncbi:MAG: peptidylprolyl isomerase [Candidatus Micrarchaeota archaeon]